MFAGLPDVFARTGTARAQTVRRWQFDPTLPDGSRE